MLTGPCFFCHGNSDQYWCHACDNDLVDIKQERCPVCAERTDGARICGQCLSQVPAFDLTYVGFDYCYPFDRLLQKMKFAGKPEFLPHLTERFIHATKLIRQTLPQAIIPVPLHPKRQRQRGFNQAKLIAHYISQKINIPVVDNAISRSKDTAPQSELNAADRKKNVKQAFKITKPLSYQRVAICDDIVTTGATVNELAKLLRNSGCQEITIWALAKTPG